MTKQARKRNLVKALSKIQRRDIDAFISIGGDLIYVIEFSKMDKKYRETLSKAIYDLTDFVDEIGDAVLEREDNEEVEFEV